MKCGFPPWQAAERGAARAQSGNERPEGLGIFKTTTHWRDLIQSCFRLPLEENREPDEYSWGGDELCCLQLRATLKALMLLLLSQEVL